MSQDIPGQVSTIEQLKEEQNVVTQQPRTINHGEYAGDASALAELSKTDRLVVQEYLSLNEGCCCNYEGMSCYC